MNRVLLGIVILSATVLHAQEFKPQDIYRRVLPSVVTLHVAREDGNTVTGTAFMALKDGLAITAWHVVQDASGVVARFSDGEEFEASGLVDKDERRDIAIIKIKAFGRPLLKLAPSDPEIGSKVYTVGSPLGLDFTISDGLLSQIQIASGIKQFQFSCPASPGNSGGPLLNALGQVVGVVSWQVRDGQNLNFAIPASYARGLDLTLPTQPWRVHQTSTKTKVQPAYASPPVVTSVVFAKGFNDDFIAINPTRIFGPYDRVSLCVTTDKVQPGIILKVQWMYIPTNQLVTVDSIALKSPGLNQSQFWMERARGLPAGEYKVETFLDGIGDRTGMFYIAE